jgi:hypothetical protein
VSVLHSAQCMSHVSSHTLRCTCMLRHSKCLAQRAYAGRLLTASPSSRTPQSTR